MKNQKAEIQIGMRVKVDAHFQHEEDFSGFVREIDPITGSIIVEAPDGVLYGCNPEFVFPWPDLEQEARISQRSLELYGFVKDYFDQADCGDGGEHDEDKSHGRCWHCTARRLVSEIEGRAA